MCSFNERNFAVAALNGWNPFTGEMNKYMKMQGTSTSMKGETRKCKKKRMKGKNHMSTNFLNHNFLNHMSMNFLK
jgi:hypothetical protein